MRRKRVLYWNFRFRQRLWTGSKKGGERK